MTVARTCPHHIPANDTMLRLFEVLSAARLDLGNEKATQEDVAKALTAAGLSFKREHRLAPGDIVDFLVEGVALEIKLRYPRRQIARQIERYARSADVRALILATNTSIHLPAEIRGKPVRVLSLGQAWL